MSDTSFFRDSCGSGGLYLLSLPRGNSFRNLLFVLARLGSFSGSSFLVGSRVLGLFMGNTTDFSTFRGDTTFFPFTSIGEHSTFLISSVTGSTSHTIVYNNTGTTRTTSDVLPVSYFSIYIGLGIYRTSGPHNSSVPTFLYDDARSDTGSVVLYTRFKFDLKYLSIDLFYEW